MIRQSAEAMVAPAVGSTKSILASIKNLAPTVKRVVITSSLSAVIDASKGIRPNYVYTEKDWNPVSIHVNELTPILTC
jgi:hypothetical protein